MRICVFGLWHLGCVTAACVAEKFTTVGCDPDRQTVTNLAAGHPPIFEPGLEDLITRGAGAGRLTFTSDPREAVEGAEVVWIAFDTPVDDEDTADVEFVARHIRGIFPHLSEGTMVLISSQVPVGFTSRIEEEFRSAHPDRRVGFAYSPENLRLGTALESFRRPQRIVVGVRPSEDRTRLEMLLGSFCSSLEWMSVESAEMTKHALNAFLANSIAFINEIAALGEAVGADARDVARGLKSDARIGPRAYLNPGGAFAGGTLARDVSALGELANRAGLPAPLLKAIYTSNRAHADWPRRKLQELLGDLAGTRIAVLGLTYKAGTDTLRRSAAVELCQWLHSQGAAAHAYDPAVRAVPIEMKGFVQAGASIREALNGADAAVIATEWPEFRTISYDDLVPMRRRILVDPNRFLDSSLRNDARLLYAAVGDRAKRQ